MQNDDNQKENQNRHPVDAHRDSAEVPSPQLVPEPDLAEIGDRVREIRKQKDLTIKALADRCQISPNTLSLVENNHTSPSLRTLSLLAQGLGVSITSFLEPEPSGQDVVYQRHGQRAVTQFTNGTIENLGDGLPPLGAEPILVTLETQAAKANRVTHAGREFVYCIAGSVACWIDGTRYALSVGDSLLFDASLPHYWENTRPQPSRLLVLFCPMDADDHPVEQHLNH